MGGPFLTALRQATRDSGLWVCCGVTLRAGSNTDVDGENRLLQGVALIGADGWLHGVHTNQSPEGPYVTGSGDWPATQNARPRGVYDTELGRIAIRAALPGLPELAQQEVTELAQMGAELIVIPPGACDAPA